VFNAVVHRQEPSEALPIELVLLYPAGSLLAHGHTQGAEEKI
jgi:hypothetical protein